MIIIDVLTRSPHPMSIRNILDALAGRQIDVRAGDKNQWLARILRRSTKIVRLSGFGYWLNSRPYGPAFYDGCGKPEPQHVRIGNAVVKLIARAQQPMSLGDIVAAIEQNGMSVRSAAKEQWVRNLLIRNRDRVVKLIGFGYWSKSRAYAPALYYPHSDVPRSQANRILEFLKGYLARTKRPVSLCDFLEALKNDGIEIRSLRPEALVRNALGKDHAFVYLPGHGHWLRASPYPPANYDP